MNPWRRFPNLTSRSRSSPGLVLSGSCGRRLGRDDARCVVGLEDVWIGRMDQSLHLEEP